MIDNETEAASAFYSWIKSALDCERRHTTNLRNIIGGREARSYYEKAGGLSILRGYDDGLHAAPKVAELWAFETGRLP